jgi:Mrp family chromosome partitioning ATPase
MTQSNGATTLVLRSKDVEPIESQEQGETPLRVVPVWASPLETSLLAVLRDGWPAVSASLRVIRHRLEQLRGRGMWSYGVTSARAEEGKSTLAAQLALVLNEAQRARVLLVEASMHRPSLARLLGLQVPTGLGFSAQIVQRMRGSLEPWSVLALGPSLHVLAESEAEPGCPDALYSRHFRGAIEGLGRSYDWVIVDSPSVLGSGDANVVEEAVDGMIVAARSRASRAVDLRAALRQLGDRKAVGVVLWDAHE